MEPLTFPLLPPLPLVEVVVEPRDDFGGVVLGGVVVAIPADLLVDRVRIGVNVESEFGLESTTPVGSV